MPPMLLIEGQMNGIYWQIRQVFNDFPFFDALLAEKVWQVIRDSCYLEINFESIKEATNKYFKRKAFKGSEELQLLWRHVKFVLQTTYVAILASCPQTETDEHSRAAFLVKYPEFAFQEGMHHAELDKLFLFWKMLKVAITIIKPQQNKQTIINIAGRLEGSQCAYITGSGQRQEVSNRVLIYERESGVKPEKRDWRKEQAPAQSQSNTSKKRNRKQESDEISGVSKRLKTLCDVDLPAEEISMLLRQPSPTEDHAHQFPTPFLPVQALSSIPLGARLECAPEATVYYNAPPVPDLAPISLLCEQVFSETLFSATCVALGPAPPGFVVGNVFD